MTIYILAIFILGVIVGSFLNAAVYRVKHKKPVCFGRSACPTCKKTLAWYELVPLLSFVQQRGRCRGCKKKISWQYPLSELVTGSAFVLVALVGTYAPVLAGIHLHLAVQWVLTSLLIFIFLYDYHYFTILDSTTLVPAVIYAPLALHFGWISVFSLVVGASVGFGFFFVQSMISEGRWVGGGDVKFGLLMGTILGWPLIVLGLLLSYVIGAVASSIHLARGEKKMKSKIPFGTYLALGTFATMLWGHDIMNWYLSLL
jgi:leader peptidase (prepilin peptidase) / N-methyltransferase